MTAFDSWKEYHFVASHYVWHDSPNLSAPYTNWATAAHVIQDAEDPTVRGKRPKRE
jgi:hypothetical protein